MVYTRKTWISNEVITKDALNNIESGVENAYKTSEMIGDGALDMDSNPINNVSALDVDSVFDTTSSGIAYPSQTLQYSKDTETSKDLNTGAFIEVASITLGATHVGTTNGFLVMFEARADYPTTRAQLRINDDLIISDDYVLPAFAYGKFVAYALALAQGDKISVYMIKGPSLDIGWVKNFRLYADYVLKTVGVDNGTFS